LLPRWEDEKDGFYLVYPVAVGNPVYPAYPFLILCDCYTQLISKGRAPSTQRFVGGQALAQPNNVFEVVDVRAVACDDELLEDCDEVAIEVDVEEACDDDGVLEEVVIEVDVGGASDDELLELEDSDVESVCDEVAIEVDVEGACDDDGVLEEVVIEVDVGGVFDDELLELEDSDVESVCGFGVLEGVARGVLDVLLANGEGAQAESVSSPTRAACSSLMAFAVKSDVAKRPTTEKTAFLQTSVTTPAVFR
jgi:hypothetical protein